MDDNNGAQVPSKTDQVEDKTETVTLEMAESKRANQGFYEMEVWAEGAEGMYQWKNCTKNPGHNNFIPVHQFSLHDLPKPYQSQQLFDLIQAQADLTVRLRVKYTSHSRPDGYPFCEFRGTHITHTGSGFVFTEPFLVDDGTPCPCVDCVKSQKPILQWWRVTVTTARHVVYDEEEAKCAIADVFYDDAAKPEQVKNLNGIGYLSKIPNGDYCRLQCATHDEKVGQSLLLSSKHYENLVKLCKIKFRVTPDSFPLYIVLTSHPHGIAKHVTIGERKERIVVNDDVDGADDNQEWTEYTYNTPTCPGCSGAPVYILGRTETARLWQSTIHNHSEGFPNGINKSSRTMECFVNKPSKFPKGASRALPL